jgi:hypothetical protein
MTDINQLKQDADQAGQLAEINANTAKTNPTELNIGRFEQTARDYVDLCNKLDALGAIDKCRLADAYMLLATALRALAHTEALPANAEKDITEATDLEQKAAENYRLCAMEHFGKTNDPTLSAGDKAAEAIKAEKAFRKAAKVNQQLGDFFKGLAEQQRLDWCTAGEAYFRAAEMMRAAAKAEGDPGIRLGYIREADDLYEKAAECFKKCGDAAMAKGNFGPAADAYHKEAMSHDRDEEGEARIFAKYKGKTLTEDDPRRENAKEAENAKRRRDDAKKKKGEAEEREKRAREKFLE